METNRPLLLELLNVILVLACTVTCLQVKAQDGDSSYYFPSSNLNDSLFSYYHNPLYSNELIFSNFKHCNNVSLLEALNNEDGLYGLPLDIYSDHFEEYPYTRAYGKIRDLNRGQVVWTANVDAPVGENACLELSDGDGNLKLVDYDANKTVWQTNHTSSGATNASLTITYEGNLVLFTNTTSDTDATLKQRVLWQSYDEPTDTLMVLQVLPYGRNLTTSSTTTDSGGSNKTAKYTLVVEHDGTLVLSAKIGSLDKHSNGSNASYSGYSQQYESPYWVSHLSNGEAPGYAAALCWYSNNKSNLYLDIVPLNRSQVSNYNQISPVTCGRIASQSSVFELKSEEGKPDNTKWNITYATFVRLEADGDLHAYTVNDTRYPNSTAVWKDFSSLFKQNPCYLPLHCGFYGICDVKNNRCIGDCGGSQYGLEPEPEPDTGCKFRGDGNTEPNGSCITQGTGLGHVIKGVHYFSNTFVQPDQINVSDAMCRDVCSNNCSCTAAFWNSTSDGSCFLILGPVGTIIMNSSDGETSQGYFKYMAAPSGNSRRDNTTAYIATATVALALTAAVLVIGYIWVRQREGARQLEDRELEMELLGVFLLGSKPRRFTWDEVRRCTCGFSDPLGSGGFGNVFRGAMADGTPVAVKQLIDGRQQGSKEFMAEVSILGRTHHLHLVRLIGFCLEGAGHKLLVYEYMENGSLDAWIFSKKPGSHVAEPEEQNSIEKEHSKLTPQILRWEQRFNIALGTAKGLAYLHEECEDRVIHMDLKPQNILLGADFFPKISDFGMSRRVARGPDQESAVVTLMRGTPGYLAPEWLTDGAVTEKCDVYSFGIMLLEIVSGKRVLDWRAVRRKLERRPTVGEGVMELVDERLMDYGVNAKVYDEQQAVRMVQVAMLCVHSNPKSRPSMTSVVQMLEGKVEVIPHAPIDDYMQELGFLPSSMSKNYVRIKQDGVEEDWEGDGDGDETGVSTYWSSSGNSSFHEKKKKMMMMMSNGKKECSSKAWPSWSWSNGVYKYMEMAKSAEFMDDRDDQRVDQI